MQVREGPMLRQLKAITTRDTRRRIVLVKPSLWDPTERHAVRRDAEVDYYMDLKAVWASRVDGSEGVWEVPPKDLLV